MVKMILKPAMLKERILTHLFGAVMGVRTTEPVVALTFDDGPDPDDTPKILDLLEHHGVKATFFILGIRALQYPELIERIVQAGHALGNHSWSHRSMPSLNSFTRLQEIKKTHNILKPFGKMLFRPPFGHMDWPTYRDVLRCGHRLVTWSVSAVDWLDHSEKEIFVSIESKLKPGRIVLLHDSLYTFGDIRYRDRKPLLSALNHLFKELNPQYSFVTVPELFKRGRLIKRYQHNLGDPVWLKNMMCVNNIN